MKNIINYDKKLLDMLQHQIVARGIMDPRILESMQRVPRHFFVPEEMQEEAYDDRPLALPEDRATISQPYMVAYMTDALQCRSSDRVLEVGTGSGYQAAILSYLCREVYTVERYYSLSVNAERTVQLLGRTNIRFHIGDGFEGWPEKAPFDKIIVTAASRKAPQALLDQLALGGSLLIPLGDPLMQTLTRIQRTSAGFESRSLIPCVFVPLISRSKDMTQADDPGLPDHSAQ